MDNSTSTFKAEAGTMSYNVKLYSFKKGLIKGGIALASFAVPFFIFSFPDIANLTIGAGLVMLVNYLKFTYL